MHSCGTCPPLFKQEEGWSLPFIGFWTTDFRLAYENGERWERGEAVPMAFMPSEPHRSRKVVLDRLRVEMVGLFDRALLVHAEVLEYVGLDLRNIPRSSAANKLMSVHEALMSIHAYVARGGSWEHAFESELRTASPDAAEQLRLVRERISTP